MVYELMIPKWEKYNPRSDVKSSTWLRLSNDFFSDPDFYGTALSMRMVYLFVLCAASKKMNGGRCRIHTRMAADQLLMDEKLVQKHISELLSLGFVQIVEDQVNSTRSNPISNMKFPSATNERTNERTDERTREKHASAVVEKKSGKKQNTFDPDLVELFSDAELKEWLMSSGNNAKSQAILFDTYQDDDLRQEITSAYLWQLERTKRGAGAFLVSWMKRSKAQSLESLKTDFINETRKALGI